MVDFIKAKKLRLLCIEKLLDIELVDSLEYILHQIEEKLKEEEDAYHWEEAKR
jgi:hypothetical protein